MDIQQIEREFGLKKAALTELIADSERKLEHLQLEQQRVARETVQLSSRKTVSTDELDLKIKDLRHDERTECERRDAVADEITRLEKRKRKLSVFGSVVIDACKEGMEPEETLPAEAEMEDIYPMLYNGNSISPEDFPQCVWIKDFISLTGGAVYAQDREPNDVDIIVKASATGGGGFSIELDPSINMKLNRMLNKILPDKEVHWTASPHGSNFRHCALFDLVLVPKERFEMTEINEPEFAQKFYDAKNVEIFKFFSMLKPMAGRFKEEEYSIDSVIHVIESRPIDWYKEKIATQVKYDGIHSQIHKDKSGKVLILTEEGTDITAKLPSLVDEIKSINGSFILAAELEIWREGKHAARQEMAALIHKKKYDEDEKLVRANIFDCLYFEVGNE